MPTEFIYPALTGGATETPGGWTPDPTTGGTALYVAVDEVTPSTTDYIRSGTNPVNDIAIIPLGNPTGAFTAPVTLYYNFNKGVANATVVNLKVELRQGTTVIASKLESNMSSSDTAGSFTLSAPELAAISDWNNLFVALVANPPTGDAFDALFAAGEKGFYYDLSDTTTTFQDTAGTTALTTNGQTGRRVNDKSPNGKHLITNNTGFYYISSGGLEGLTPLEGNMLISGLDFSSTDKITVILGYNLVEAGTATIFHLGLNTATPTSDNPGFDLERVWAGGTPPTHFTHTMGNGGRQRADSPAGSFGRQIFTGIFNFAAGPNSCQLRRNGVAVSTPVGDNGNTNTAWGASQTMSLMSYNDGVNPAGGDVLYGIVVVGRLLTGPELAAAEAKMAVIAGVTL